MSTDTNKERADFEAWAVNEGFQIRRLHNPEAGRDYGIDSAQDAWEGWRARAAKAPAAPTGWYALAADGMATLCVDRDDAEKTAAESEKEWPNCGPFRAVQLYTAPPPPPEGMVGGWIALPGALPEPGVPVLLDIGKKYPIRAMWAAKHTVQAADDDTDWGEYVEADDMYYAPEGWYEWNQNEEVHWAVTETALNWMPIPPPRQGAAKGDGNG